MKNIMCLVARGHHVGTCKPILADSLTEKKIHRQIVYIIIGALCSVQCAPYIHNAKIFNISVIFLSAVDDDGGPPRLFVR